MDPKGTVRSPVSSWLFCFIPLFNIFWVFYYQYTNYAELKAYLNDDDLSPALSTFVWPFLTCGLYGFYEPFKMGALIQRAQVKAGMADAPNQGGLFLLFAFLCAFNRFKYQEELNKVWQS